MQTILYINTAAKRRRWWKIGLTRQRHPPYTASVDQAAVKEPAQARVPALSPRARVMPPSPIRKLVPLADQAKKKGVKVYHLNIGQPDIPTPEPFLAAVRSFDKKVLEYSNSRGDAGLIEALVTYYRAKGLVVTSEEIQVTTGGSEAILFALLCVTSPGDEVLVFEPFYTNYNGFAVMAGVTLIPVPTSPETGYHLPTREKIEAKISPRTKAILICTPNNPTGTLYTRAEMQLLADLTQEHNLFFISDETYREFAYDGRHVSILEFPGLDGQAILVDSISKRFSACGARVGCLVSRNRQIVNAAWRFGQARLSSPTIEMQAAIPLMQLDQNYYDALVSEFKKRRDTVVHLLTKIPGAFCVPPEGAFYIMATLPVDDTEEFARFLLADFSHQGSTTMIAPGSGFYATPGQGKTEARIAYVLNTGDLEKAMQILAKAAEAYQLK